jgi:hypothetical protein
MQVEREIEYEDKFNFYNRTKEVYSMDDLRLILFIVIIFVFGLSMVSVLVSVSRRMNNKRRYEKIDGLRDKFMPAISAIITSGSIDSIHQFLNVSNMHIRSHEWVALEQVLFALNEQEEQKYFIRKLFDAFGYTEYYCKQLSSRRSPIKLSSAANKLGRIGDPSAIEPLTDLLNHEKSEVATVAFRALCRIGTNNALRHVLASLPNLLENKNITVKAIQTSLLLFKPWAGDSLLQYARTIDHSEILALILEILLTFPVNREITELALTMISHPDPEVRAKALRVIARNGIDAASYDSKAFLKLLSDPVWFVRLQAAKTIGKIKCDNFIEMLKKLALDERWQVRDAATLSLVELGDASLDTFLALLETPDRYAKESISEEIQRTGFVQNLIEYLGGSDIERKDKAKHILTSMHKVGFSTPLREAMESGTSRPDISKELANIILAETVA